MKALTRIRIILFALMIFGAFANFAQNEWGNTAIAYCEGLMALSFLTELGINLFNRIRKKQRKLLSQIELGLVVVFALLELFVDLHESNFGVVFAFFLLLVLFIVAESLVDLFKKTDNKRLHENFFLALFFIAMYRKNMHMSGGNVFLILSMLFLLPYYITSTIKFIRANYKFNKTLTLILALGSLAGILLGITFVFKTMHWEFPDIVFYFAMLLSLIMIGGVVKWKYNYNNQTITIFKGLSLFKSHIILVYYIGFVFCTYAFFRNHGLVPKFYSEARPKSLVKLSESGNPNTFVEEDFFSNSYNNFTSNSKKNGFIK